MKLDKLNVHILKPGDTIEIVSRWFTGITTISRISMDGDTFVFFITAGDYGYTSGMFDGNIYNARIESINLICDPTSEEIVEDEAFYEEMLES